MLRDITGLRSTVIFILNILFWSNNLINGIEIQINYVLLGLNFINNFEGSRTCYNYLDMLQNIKTIHDIYFQYNSALPHYITVVFDYVEKAFNGRVIDQHGAIVMPPCSLDITPIDFFVGFTKY